MHKFKTGQRVKHETRGVIFLGQAIGESGNWYAGDGRSLKLMIVSEDLIKPIKKRRRKR